MAVMHPDGVVGQVVSAAQHSARVLLITDASSSVDALVQEGRVRGIAEGAGSQGCELRYVTKDAVIKSGELVVTSGFDRVYPKGVVLGVVSHVHAGEAGLFQSVRVKPAVDFSRLEEVMILPSETSMLAVQPGGTLPLEPFALLQLGAVRFSRSRRWRISDSRPTSFRSWSCS